MDAARQVIRWSIPGWMTFFTIVGFQVIASLVCEYVPHQFFMTALTATITPAVAAAIFAAAIPLGFLVYQIYYAIYGNLIPFSFVNRDRGAEILEKIPLLMRNRLEEITGGKINLEKMYDEINIPLLGNPLRRLSRIYRNDAGKKLYRDKLTTNWAIVKFNLSLLTIEKESSEFKNEFTSVSDIYHGIGATRTSLFLGYFGFIGYNLLVHFAEWKAKTFEMILGIAIVSLISYLILRILERTRTETVTRMQSILTNGLRWYANESLAQAEEVYDPNNLTLMD